MIAGGEKKRCTRKKNTSPTLSSSYPFPTFKPNHSKIYAQIEVGVRESLSAEIPHDARPAIVDDLALALDNMVIVVTVHGVRVPMVPAPVAAVMMVVEVVN